MQQFLIQNTSKMLVNTKNIKNYIDYIYVGSQAQLQRLSLIAQLKMNS